MLENSTRRRAARALAALLALALLAAGCGSDTATTEADPATDSDAEAMPDDSEESDASMDDMESDDMEEMDETDETDESDETDETDETDDDAAAGGDAIIIEAAVAGGEVTVESTRFEVPLNSEVVLNVSSDVAEHVHLHGYDVMADVTPDSPAELAFTADVPGVFEVELEDSATFLFEVAVN